MIFDTGALIALDRGAREIYVLLRSAADDGDNVTVPAPVIGQAWRNGARQARLAQALGFCRIDETTGRDARDAGELLARSGTSDVIDAFVVVGAARRRDEILTSDPGDIRVLVEALSSPRRVVVTTL
jgi:hypothetical protein